MYRAFQQSLYDKKEPNERVEFNLPEIDVLAKVTRAAITDNFERLAEVTQINGNNFLRKPIEVPEKERDSLRSGPVIREFITAMTAMA